jgi:hypothetical protein
MLIQKAQKHTDLRIRIRNTREKKGIEDRERRRAIGNRKKVSKTERIQRTRTVEYGQNRGTGEEGDKGKG